MQAKDLIGRTFSVVRVEQEKLNLVLFLQDAKDNKLHLLKVSEESGPGADSNWYNWAEATFDGSVIFKT